MEIFFRQFWNIYRTPQPMYHVASVDMLICFTTESTSLVNSVRYANTLIYSLVDLLKRYSFRLNLNTDYKFHTLQQSCVSKTVHFFVVIHQEDFCPKLRETGHV